MRVDRRTDAERSLRRGDAVVVQTAFGPLSGTVKRTNWRGATIRLGPTMETRIVFGKGTVRRA